MPMNPEVKAKWVAALRSGGYKQARQALRNQEGGYCCLGVLCEISGRGEWADEGAAKTYLGDESLLQYLGDESLLPPSVMAWAGLDEPDPTTDSGESLTELNDGGKSFSEIADIIEREL